MRDWWYGDKRDVVKWGTVLVLARKRSISAVLQVALYRPDRSKYHLIVDGSSELLPVEIIQHFRDIEHIRQLAANVNLKIDVHKALFQWCPEFRTRENFRKAYFDDVMNKIRQYAEPVIVFLDPDTGIAPENYGYEHVTDQEIQTVLRAMKHGDILLFYQHARQRDGDWRISTKEEFSRAVGIEVPVDTVSCNDITKDVMFFVVDRSNWIDPITEGYEA